ncbi:MAG: rRNA pseudouridine synthase [Anaerolineaceae bacterium]|nr:MAG: rRNA pseudouridine synthase [Anaerolineaceae bacterium]
MQERLQKLMARAGYGSRRENERLISAGRVLLNGRLARLGDKADLQVDQIKVDGKLLTLEREPFTYIMLNKPRGVISSLDDELQQARTTVRDLIPEPGHLYPVGRLDKPSEGLILMTNDGQLAHHLTHPRYEHEKEYEVEVEGTVSNQVLGTWRQGVLLDDRLTAPAHIEVLERNRNSTRLRIVLREGRKRQIRRIAAGLGHPVLHLRRVKIGPLELGSLKPGQWRRLTSQEIDQLRAAARKKPNYRRTNRNRNRHSKK